MEKIKVLIVEDELIVSEELRELMLRNDYDVIGQAADSNGAMELITQQVPDIILMDIDIKGELDGIELAHKILHEHNCAIIFLTAFDDSYFLKRASKVGPAAYIVKPFEERNLKSAIEMAFYKLIGENDMEENSTSYFIDDRVFIKENQRFKKIALDEIRYVEAVGSYSDIYLSDGKMTLSINLKNFEKRLSSKKFLRVHRSYLINSEKIDAFEGNTIYIDSKAIPLSPAHKEEFLKIYKFI